MAKQKLPTTIEETFDFIFNTFTFEERVELFEKQKTGLINEANAKKIAGEKAANVLKIIEQNGKQ